jgi:hypothetical protein
MSGKRQNHDSTEDEYNIYNYGSGSKFTEFTKGLIYITLIVLIIAGVTHLPIPEYVEYGVDCDGDGNYDIIEEVPDNVDFTEENAYEECKSELDDVFDNSVEELDPDEISYSLIEQGESQKQ